MHKTFVTYAAHAVLLPSPKHKLHSVVSLVRCGGHVDASGAHCMNPGSPLLPQHCSRVKSQSLNPQLPLPRPGPDPGYWGVPMHEEYVRAVAQKVSAPHARPLHDRTDASHDMSLLTQIGAPHGAAPQHFWNGRQWPLDPHDGPWGAHSPNKYAFPSVWHAGESTKAVAVAVTHVAQTLGGLAAAHTTVFTKL